MQESKVETLTEKQIVRILQLDGEAIYFAYFSRDREYSYHRCKTIDGIIEFLSAGDYLGEDCIYRNEKDDCQIEFRCDEWVIFSGKGTADEFFNRVVELYPNDCSC